MGFLRIGISGSRWQRRRSRRSARRADGWKLSAGKISPAFTARATERERGSISAVLDRCRHHRDAERGRSGISKAHEQPWPEAVSGLKTRATRLIEGSICLSRSAHLPAIENSVCGEAGDVAARMRQVRHETLLDRIGDCP